MIKRFKQSSIGLAVYKLAYTILTPVFAFLRLLEWKLRYEKNIGRKRIALPDFIIIGPPKCGTTWLKVNLKRHPRVYIHPGECEYFTYHLDEPLSHYSSFFTGGQGKLIGEKSPQYSTLTPYRIRLLHAVLPRVKLILIHRDPVERAWSAARWFLFKNTDPRSLNKEKIYRFFRKDKQMYDYAKIMRNYTNVFPKDQIITIEFDDIRRQPEKVLVNVFRFLRITTNVDWQKFLPGRKINRGRKMAIPKKLRSYLRLLYSSTRKSRLSRSG